GPYGKPDQPRFLNACALIETEKEGEEILPLLKDIEKQVGRKEREKWGPREIDIDIIFIDQKVIESETLQVPHPEMHKRDFVLKPLAQIIPDWIHPVLKRTVEELASEIPEKDISIVRIARL
ncbi:MAG: 2-amino-4-hydroxy-6-hydroxymethyldihydropteridine diphosphokinase, partial [Synergistales bacterium]|nr:2-amino-4-hydroxy-6-hydroxymethyldihydropteridine diphosphokinase [Synergistales bacterium]